MALGNTPLSQNLELFMSISPFMAGAILLIIGGSMMIIVGIWGCVSSMASNSKCLLIVLKCLIISLIVYYILYTRYRILCINKDINININK